MVIYNYHKTHSDNKNQQKWSKIKDKDNITSIIYDKNKNKKEYYQFYKFQKCSP